MVRAQNLFGLVLGTAIWLGVSQGVTHASHCAHDEYNHNGSLMDLTVCDGGVVNISYGTPRPGLRKQGVIAGTSLFDGVETTGGNISGTARVFSRKCGPAAYAVRGRHVSNSKIILTGRAPKRDKQCRITGYRDDRLVFTLTVRSGGGPAVVQPTCPDGYVLVGGVCQISSAGGDWYAIGGSFPTKGEALQRVAELGSESWYPMLSGNCPNFTPGYWIAALGPTQRSTALAWAEGSAHVGAIAKKCH